MKERKQLIDTINVSIFNALANLHTATIAKVVTVDEKTIDVQPVINRTVGGESIELPVFSKVPPVFLQGGDSYSAHPITTGDYCLLIITERCFDRWYAGQDNRRPAEYRMHDYSDGLAIVGVNPLAAAITIPQVITHIGDTYAEGDYTQIGNYTHTGNRDQTGDYTQEGDFTRTGNVTNTGNYVITGNVTIAGSLSVTAGAGDVVEINGVTLEITDGDVVSDGVSLETHTHSGVESGPDNTGEPN